jgi:predicted RND superfamily exporter protein
VVAVNGFERVVEAITSHTRIAIAVMLVLTVALGAGAGQVSESSSLDQFQTDSPEGEKLDYIESNFTTGQENVTRAQIIVRAEDGGNVLSRDALLDVLRFEREIANDPRVEDTLAGNNSITGVANAVATTAIRQSEARELRERSGALNATSERIGQAIGALVRNPTADPAERFETVSNEVAVELDAEDRTIFVETTAAARNASGGSAVSEAVQQGIEQMLAAEYAAVERGFRDLRTAPQPGLQAQIDAIDAMEQSEIEALVGQLLGEDGDQRLLALMPTDYDRGATEARGTVVIVSQTAEGVSPAGTASDAVVESQLAIQEIGAGSGDGLEYLTFGVGIITDEIQASQSDSLAIVGPLALIFVLVTLVIAYRDALDIVLGLFGIFAVLMWTFGFMGWAGINFNQIMIAVPVLLIGLSIDYAIHIFMRHREEREHTEEGPRKSMRVALSGVGIALLWVTATTVIGFLSNLTSPVPPIQDFGVASAFGIFAAFVIFGVLIPSLKVEIDGFLENRFGWDRKKRAFGTGGGRFSSALSTGAVAAKKLPWVVILLALLITAGGVYGATQVDTSFNQEDFLAEDPPGWMESLPEPFKPGEYSAKENLQLVNENYVRQDTTAQILVEGSITDDDALRRLADAKALAAEKGVTQKTSDGAVINGPIAQMQALAGSNGDFGEAFSSADTDGDGIPDRNLEAVYDAFLRVAPDTADDYLYRAGPDDYRAFRLEITITGGASGADVTDQMRNVADEVDGAGLTATATGSSILNNVVQNQLLQTVIQSLIITLVATVLFLMIAYRIVEGSATLGAVTLMPVFLSVAWILGTMWLLGIPFNVLTGTITSLTVGLGVAYSIHISERYNQELERRGSVWEAMNTAVTGTGGALLGSAATTVGGFGVLTFAILPPLQQFGLITAMTIIYAFLAAVLVLPSMLVVWTRFAGPDYAKSDFGGTGVQRVVPGTGDEGTTESDD